MAIAAGILLSCEKNRRPSRYLIPEGYVGWVKTNFRVPNAPPLPLEDGRYLLVFPESGLLETSSDIETGWAKDEYYYYSDSGRTALPQTTWGKGGLIWGESNGWSGTEYQKRDAVFEHFFVGSEEEFRLLGNEKDDQSERIIGNRKQKP